jgi:hypothetical protein
MYTRDRQSHETESQFSDKKIIIPRHRNKYMEEKFHREKKTIELIETLVECIEN